MGNDYNLIKDIHLLVISGLTTEHENIHKLRHHADLDEKIQIMVNLLQDDGEGSEVELLKIVQDLYKSYLHLAEEYE